MTDSSDTPVNRYSVAWCISPRGKAKVCVECGVVVSSTSTHDAFHDRLDAVPNGSSS